LLERDPKAAGEELFKMEDLARKTTKEIRHMLFTLRPLVLEHQGLVAALHQLAEKMRDTHGQNVIVEAEPGVDNALEKNYQGVLFYIIEEATNNARKHAQAEHIWVRLKQQGDIMLAEIQDDGVGFNLGAVDENYDKRGSLGMVNMRERAEMLNGVAKIMSAEGKGTRINIYVPLTEAARDRLRV
jgi:signal transduction histidine kinase